MSSIKVGRTGISFGNMALQRHRRQEKRRPGGRRGSHLIFSGGGKMFLFFPVIMIT
jgi:hypothetical protein